MKANLAQLEVRSCVLFVCISKLTRLGESRLKLLVRLALFGDL